MESGIQSLQLLIPLLHQRSSEIIALLQTYESFDTAQFELKVAVETLEHIDRQEVFLSGAEKHNSLAVFFPINLPLYSLVLYALSPSPFFERVLLRVPHSATFIVQELVNLLELHRYGIELIHESRSFFVQNTASNAEAIVFTGRSENAEIVQQQCARSLFFFNGYGVNPVVIGSDADLEAVVPQLVNIRTFNSGQDCMAPDIILVHENCAARLLELLLSALSQLKVGKYDDSEVQIGPLTEQESFNFAVKFISQEQDNVVFGGESSESEKTIFPTIIQKPLAEVTAITEFFAPIFLLATYSTDDELTRFFSAPNYLPYQMYESVFGTITAHCFGPQLLHNKTTVEIDDGNAAFGGYSEKVNGILFNKFSLHKPFLINEELSQWRANKKEYLKKLSEHAKKRNTSHDVSAQW